MATKKNNYLGDDHTTQLADFPVVAGKIVQAVELFSDKEYCGITIRFTDQTALDFTLETAVFVFPSYSDRTGGNETIIKEYKPIRSHVDRE